MSFHRLIDKCDLSTIISENESRTIAVKSANYLSTHCVTCFSCLQQLIQVSHLVKSKYCQVNLCPGLVHIKSTVDTF